MFGYLTNVWIGLTLCSVSIGAVVFERQELAMVAPYSPAGLTPNPPFDLPTEEQPVAFPEPDVTYGPPDQTYGPPDQTYGPPDLTYGPPDAEEVEVVPAETYGPPAETYGPPPPTAQPANDPAAASPPQSAALINLASLPLPPQAQFVLPLLNRFTAFRNLRTASATPQRPKPAKLQARPQAGSRPRPAKIINGNAVFPPPSWLCHSQIAVFPSDQHAL